MSIKIGDKVRFLNSVGGGIVVRLIGKERVGIEDLDGFEIPALIKECVVIREGTSAVEKAFVAAGAERGNDFALPADRQSSSLGPVSPSSSEGKGSGEFDLKKNSLSTAEIKGGNRLTVALAFLPNSLQSLQEGNFEAYIINDSNYYLMLNYATAEKDEFSTVYAGVIEPNSKYCIDEFDRFDLTKMTRLLIQAVAFKHDKTFVAKTPVQAELKLDATKFYRLHFFTENDYFEEKAYLISIVDKDQEIGNVEINTERLKQSMAEKQSENKIGRTSNKSAKVNEKGVVEVDLHIHELLDDYRAMSNTEIIQVQLECFHRVMQEYLSRKGQRIVFIHGKGEGVLRKALLDELKQKYGKCLFQDASFREYGFGATMVIVK